MQPTGSRPVIQSPFFLPPTQQPVVAATTPSPPQSTPTVVATVNNPKYAPPPPAGSTPSTGGTVSSIQQPFQQLSVAGSTPGIIAHPFSVQQPVNSSSSLPVNTNELFQSPTTTIPKYAPPPVAGSAPPPQSTENRGFDSQGGYPQTGAPGYPAGGVQQP